jgi:uroporphyrinogen decarboxylase
MAALNHQEPDRIPLDFGSSIGTTIIQPAYDNLKKYLGLEHETKPMAARGRTVIPDETVLERFDIDTRPLLLGGFSQGDYQPIDEKTLKDVWGTIWKKAPDGHFINAEGPFQKDEANMASLESHPWPDPDDAGLYEGLGDRAEQLRKSTDYALILNLPVGPVHQCQFMRGFAEFFNDLVVSQGYIGRMLEITSDIWVRLAENALDAVGPNVDVIAWGDDIAMQQSLLMSPDTYRKLIKPHHRKMNQALKNRSEAKIQYHSCGSVVLLMEDLIEIGVDAFNPVQVSAKDMDPAILKEQFGDRLSFWGGIDTHRVLPFETPEGVRKEVRRITELMGKGGGYILASVHNIQAEVPPENIVAMFDEGKSYDLYSG